MAERIAEKNAEQFPSGFVYVYYVLAPSPDKFDLQRFDDYFRTTFGNKESYVIARHEVSAAPRDERNGPYHVRLSWDVREKGVDFQIEYRPGPRKHEGDETEPFAEEFMAWFGTFFNYNTAHAHVHARFRYPLETHQSRFPLPLRMTDFPHEAELDGIALTFPGRPEGVVSVRMNKGKSEWFAEVIAERRVKFDEFSPFHDAEVMSSILRTILPEKQS